MVPVSEALIADFGRELLARCRARRPGRGSLARADDRAMLRVMADARLKAACFRFVEVLPHLADDRAVARHLAEYLGPVHERLPWPARLLLGRSRGLSPTLVAAAARFAAGRMARRFIAGDTPLRAGERFGALRKRRWGFTIDLLGEAVLAESEADAYAVSYHDLLDHLAATARTWADDELLDYDDRGAIPRVNVSIKLSALTSRWDPTDPDGTAERVLVRLRPILGRARRLDAAVNIDMESSTAKDLTLAIVTRVAEEADFRDWPHMGLAIQAYLRSAAEDLARLLACARRRGTPLTVRLVKGAYWDQEQIQAAQRGWPVPVFSDKAATDASFEACTRWLLEHRDELRPAIAGHNVRSIAHALACAEALGADWRSYEFQMLFGMVDPLKDAVVDIGRRVRVYTPFGELLPGMAYLVRRLLENSSNISFVRAGFLEDARIEDLLMAPVPAPEVSVPPSTGFRNEPVRDFSRGEVREAADDAICRLRRELPLRIAPVVGGTPVETGRVWNWTNPSRSDEIVCSGVFADATLAHRAVALAAAHQMAWAARDVRERVACLNDLAGILGRHRDDFVARMVLEVGKNRSEADADIAEAIDFCRFYASCATRIFSPRRRDVPGELNELRHEARGVAAVIAPWNFPVAILCGMTVANLVVGNACIVKPAEQSCAIAQLFHACVLEAGVPAEVCALLPGAGEELGPALMAEPAVTVVAFTGSRAVGLQLAAEAVRLAPIKGLVTRVVAEMGGKNAIIVDDDADLDETVQGVLHSAFSFQGQKCSACSRVIVLAAIHDRLVARLAEALRSLSAGPADDPGAVIGPVIDEEAVRRLEAAIASVADPCRIAAVGPCGSGGCFVAPHVITGVPADHVLARAELFGPILAIIRVGDLDEALRVANATDYALTGGCFSRSPATLERVRRELRVGNLYLNRAITGALVDRQPFGGMRLSGLGARTGGDDYLLQFVESRSITENTFRHGMAVDREQTLT